MTKEEKIQEAYGVHWEFYKDKVDENGWVDCRKIGNGNLIPIMEVKDIQFQKHKQRPKSIQGISENNGWKKGIPIKSGQYFAFNNESNYGTAIEFNVFTDIELYKQKFTHYQKIEIPNRPIY